MGYNGGMPYLNANGSRLFYSDQGQADGLALLLLHGAAGSHLVWPGPLRQLAGARVLALDLPGHGRSDPPGRRTIAHYAASVAAFVHALALPDVVIAGHSMGAAIALTIALEPPAALRGLALLGAAGRLRANEALLGGSLADFEAAADFIVEYGFADNGLAVPTAELRRKVRAAILSVGAMTTYGDFLACHRFDARAQLAGIDLPAWVIAGSADRLVPARAAEALAGGLPRGRLARLEGVGHFSMLERPDEVAALMAAFLAEIAGSLPGQRAPQ